MNRKSLTKTLVTTPYTIWMIILVVLITATLLLCLEIQRGAVSSFLHTEPWLPILSSWIS